MQNRMGFWRNLFAGLETPAQTQTVSLDSAAALQRYYGAEAIAVEPRLPVDGVIVLSTLREIDYYELEAICVAVGWSRRPHRKVKRAVDSSFEVVTMWQQVGARRRLIGFARATSDHAFNATIWEVVVSPTFQGQGLGRLLMQYLVDRLRQAGLTQITLFADPHVVSFYEAMGFTLDPAGIKGMFWCPT
jgi:ribosomal protein S18 acetylase RimI-like enzyme